MHLLIAALAVALALCLVAIVVLVRRTRHRHAPQIAQVAPATAVANLEARMEELAWELQESVRRAEEETQRSRFLNQIGTTVDLDHVLETTLDAAVALPRVDAALVRLDGGGDEKPIVGSRGFGSDQPDATSFFGQPAGWGARAVELSYRYPEPAEGVIHAALGVPLADSSGGVGWLGIFSRDPAARFGDDDLRRAEELAERVAPALENARRFQEARQLADLDALTGLHNRRYFHETLAREVARAHRYSRGLALVIVDIDDFKGVNDRIGHLAGDGALAEVAERVREAVRESDIPCRIGGDELGLILPESRLADAERLVTRIEQAVIARPIARAGHMRVSAGFAELQPNDDSTSLFERADQSLYAVKQMRKGGGGLAAAE
ncbi:MAG TPA: sensor domain-containing diguanylate cyclase [Gaiellaceae bacterium]|nr:sensor domain-containing diguanylate cyclase [Gaiellaceae bacterium]